MKKDDGDKLRVIFSFYMSTVVGALEFGGATENFIAAILPHLSRGLKSKVAQYRAATFMILGQLVSRTNLQGDLLKTLLSALFKVEIFLYIINLFSRIDDLFWIMHLLVGCVWS